MSAVFVQILLLLLFISLGYIMSKLGKVDNRHSKLLSSLGFYIFLPANVFKTFSNNFTVEYLTQKYPLVLISAVFVVVMFIAGKFIAKALTKDPYTRRVYEYSMISSNYGYVGYTLAQAIFGDTMLLNVMMFAVPLSIYTYSMGYCSLTKNKMSLKKLMGPVNIALVAGALVGLLKPYTVSFFVNYLPGFVEFIKPVGQPLLALIESFLNKAQGAMGPISMLLTGMVISEYSLKDMLSQKSVYIISFLRLIVIPCAVCGLMLLIGLKEFVTPVLIILALPCGLNTIVFPKLIGEDCRPGAALACVTSVLCCVTIPLCLWLFGAY
ncbi:MAG: AEC family transporter [Oscillospiraceae bacterium]|nr:AEC family transporter [Oscillospiraceae bacterium]